jgi:hypothetical protein
MSRLSALALVALVACSRSEPPTPSPAASAALAAPPSANPSATPAASASGAATGPSSWSGHYTATVGSLTIPDWTGVRFRGEDASVGLGDGAMTVALDERGRASGTLDGALGASKIDGALQASDFSATLVPDDLAKGFTGTAIGTRDGDHIAGTMRLSLPTGNVVREGSFTLDRKH